MKKENEIKDYVKNLTPIKNKKDCFVNRCKENLPRISTGWLSMDKALNGGFANELYIMGAETSTGKSAFMMSLAQNIAKQGVNVLYFSLEMSSEEFIARAISSISFVANVKDNSNKRYTTGDVLYWSYDEQIKKFTKLPYNSYSKYADEYFKTYGDYLYIIEAGVDGFCAKDIANIATLFKEEHKDEQVVIFVDYLQILKADAEDRSQTDRKTKTDITVLTLKSLASQVGMPVFTVSSVSRSGYKQKISTSSYKESGDTEYTGSILIGWNWKNVTDASSDEDIKNEKEKCAKRGYRKMEFEVLKYRNSQRDYGIKLIYYPAYNYFIDEYNYFFDEYKWYLYFSGKNPFDNWDEKKDKKDNEEKGNNNNSKRKSF